jgi:hypothetical protein
MAETMTMKVSVLASGEILLDKQPVTLADLQVALLQGAKSNAAVWYYRENPGGAPPPVVADVMKLITGNRMPIRLSSKPDFSDAVAPAAVVEQNFAAIRQKAALGKLVVLRPDGQYLVVPAGPKESFPKELVASVESMLPSKVQRNVAVIGDTSWAATAAPTLQAANQAIPFFGHLMGFATIGHAVWVFDPRNTATLTAGCRDADVLLVDSARQAALPNGWQATTALVMRHPQILVHDRQTHQLRKA